LKTNEIELRSGATSLFDVQRWTFDVRRSSSKTTLYGINITRECLQKSFNVRAKEVIRAADRSIAQLAVRYFYLPGCYNRMFISRAGSNARNTTATARCLTLRKWLVARALPPELAAEHRSHLVHGSILGCLNHLQFFDQYLDCSVTF